MSAFVLWQIVNTGTVLTLFVAADHKLLVFFLNYANHWPFEKEKLLYEQQSPSPAGRSFIYCFHIFFWFFSLTRNHEIND